MHRTIWGIARAIAPYGVIALMLSPLIWFSNYALNQFGFHDGWRELNDRERLESIRLNVVHWVNAIDARIQADECVLVFRQADYAWYGRHCYISQLDKRVIPLYLSNSRAELRSNLAALQIRWIFVPYYNLPEYYSSLLEDFLADPREASIEWDLDQGRLFKINPVTVDREFRRVSIIKIDRDNLLRDQEGNVGKVIAQSRGRPFVHEMLSQRSSFTAPQMDEALVNYPRSPFCGLLLKRGKLYGYEIAVHGRGFLYVVGRFGATHFNGSDAIKLGQQILWDGAITGRRVLRGQFIVEPGQCIPMELRFSLLGAGSVTIERGEVFEYPDWTPPPNAFTRQTAMVDGWSSSSGEKFQGSWSWGRYDSGDYFLNSHPHPNAPVSLVSPPTRRVPQDPSAIRTIPVNIRIRLSATRELRIVSMTHLANHAEDQGRPPSALLDLVRKREVAPGPIATEFAGARRAFELLVRSRDSLKVPFSSEVAEVRLPSGHRQEVRSYTLFDGQIDQPESLLEFTSVVQPNDRLQLAFVLPEQSRGSPGASLRISELEMTTQTGGRSHVLFSLLSP